jgi:hypothetical protein
MGLRRVDRLSPSRPITAPLCDDDEVRTIDTVLKRVRDGEAESVEFVVRTDEPTYRERLVKMGWQPTSTSGEFTRRLDASPEVEEIFERFSRYIETMVRQKARLEPIDWGRGLREFVDRVDDSGLHWWLYGSCALAVRGLAVAPGDLDIRVDDAYLTGRVMADLLVEPVTGMRGWVADAGGRAYAGVLIEWLAGPHPSGLDPPHEQDDAASSHLELVQWHGVEIPVPTLKLQLAVAERRGLEDRVSVIRRALRT